MNTEIKEKWIAALRSGDYKQTKGQLRNEEGYCCLGVLCDVFDGSKWDSQYTYDLHAAVLPDTIKEELNINRGQEDYLIHLNDINCYSFDQIATYIEENL